VQALKLVQNLVHGQPEDIAAVLQYSGGESEKRDSQPTPNASYASSPICLQLSQWERVVLKSARPNGSLKDTLS
jgi:hypothetical protein